MVQGFGFLQGFSGLKPWEVKRGDDLILAFFYSYRYYFFSLIVITVVVLYIQNVV